MRGMTSLQSAPSVPALPHDLQTVAEVAKLLRVHPSAVSRFALRGTNGVRLRYLRVGRRMLIPAEAVAEFLNELRRRDADRFPPTPSGPTPGGEESIRAAEAAVRSAGPRTPRSSGR